MHFSAPARHVVCRRPIFKFRPRPPLAKGVGGIFASPRLVTEGGELDAKVRAHVLISGRVQGVMFRAYTIEAAYERGVRGGCGTPGTAGWKRSWRASGETWRT